MNNIYNINNVDNIYLTLTTMPERIISDHFFKVYNSLKNQSIKFKKLIINLSINEFTYNIPDYLQNDESVILNETSVCGPCAKLLGSIDIIPKNSIVIVLDDDIVFRKNFIQTLYYSYLINPNNVSSNFITQRPNFKEVAGFGGYIFNIDIVRNIRSYYETMPKCCEKIDDTWISWCFYKLNIEVFYTIDINPWDNVLDIPNTDPHPDWYELYKDTDRKKLTEEALLLLNSIE